MSFSLPRSIKSPSLDTLCSKYFILVLQYCSFSLDILCLFKASFWRKYRVFCWLFIEDLNTATNSLHTVSNLTSEDNPDHLDRLLLSERGRWGFQYSPVAYSPWILPFIWSEGKKKKYWSSGCIGILKNAPQRSITKRNHCLQEGIGIWHYRMLRDNINNSIDRSQVLYKSLAFAIWFS